MTGQFSFDFHDLVSEIICRMKQVLTAIALIIVATGCSATRISNYDEFEKVKVERLRGNGAGNPMLAKTVVCLNVLRETRWPAPTTNVSVTLVTNLSVTSITNQTVTSSISVQEAGNTNSIATPVSLSGAAEHDDSGQAPVASAISASIPDSSTAGTTISRTQNESLAAAPNQSTSSRSVQTVTLLNQQSTSNTNGLAITSGANRTQIVETNWVVTTLTNQVVTPVTNISVLRVSRPAHDYYLWTEVAPADFSLAPGENLVLLVDGQRHAFTPTQPVSSSVPRRGYLTTYYKVPAEVMAGIANAQEVRVRIKGTTSVVERNLGPRSLGNIREFAFRHLTSAKQAATKTQKKTS